MSVAPSLFQYKMSLKDRRISNMKRNSRKIVLTENAEALVGDTVTPDVYLTDAESLVHHHA
ncbi:MAG: hypothetical protein GY779_04635 [Gammaproteobacteria bacterium]|nr:hypothetical protein [Gammaproteobacteria bacterium]